MIKMEERVLKKKIVTDILFLSQVSRPASQEDLPLAKDLQEPYRPIERPVSA